MSAPALPARRAADQGGWLLLQAYGLVVSISGIAAAAYLVPSGLPTGALLVTVAGFGAGHLLRRVGLPQRLAALLAVLAALGWWQLSGAEGTLLPPPGRGDQEGGLASLLVVLVAARSFTLYSPGDVLFCAVPSLALFGLVGSLVYEAGLLGWFFVFLAATILMLGQEHHLRQRELGGAREADRTWRYRLLGSGGFVLTVVLAAWVFALVMGALGIHVHTPSLRHAGPSRAVGQAAVLVAPGNLELGQGPPSLSNATVMWVRTGTPAYWRQVVYDTYEGGAWRQELATGPWADMRVPLPTPDQARPRRGDLRQRYELAVAVSGTHFAAAEPVAARQPGVAPARFSLDQVGMLNARPADLPAGTVYDVISRPPTAPRPLPAPAEWPVPAEYRRPAEAPAIAALAAQVTAGAKTPLEQARAIERYLRGNYQYNLVRQSAPADRDVVEWFLTESRQGYCDLFASAMALMCRAVGIPARVAAGFSTGTWDDRRQAYRVAFRNAHAWPEVYLPGAGWVAFEPTPADERMPAAAAVEPVRRHRPLLLRILPAVSALLVTVGLAWLLLRRLRSRVEAGLPSGDGPRQAVIAAYLAAGRLTGRLGMPRRPAETPAEYLALLSRQAPARGLPELVPALDRLTALFTQARYSPLEVPADHAQAAQGIVAALRADYRRLARVARAQRRRS